MNLISMHWRLLALNTFGVSFCSVLYVGIHGLDQQMERTLAWMFFAAAGTSIANRFLISIQASDHETPDAEVDGSPHEKRMLDVVIWIPAVLLATSTMLIVMLENPLPSTAWMLIVLGGYIGRDIEAIARLRKRLLQKSRE